MPTTTQVYLLGVDHSLQWNRDLFLTDKLLNYIEKTIVKKKITILGEEFFPEIFKGPPYEEKGITSTTIKELANKYKLQHIYCDPNYEERKRLGIRFPYEIRLAAGIKHIPEEELSEEQRVRLRQEKKPDDEIRENFWLNKLKEFSQENVLFICGIQHLESFSDKLKNNSFNIKILPITFSPDLSF